MCLFLLMRCTDSNVLHHAGPDIVVAQEGQDVILPCVSRLIQNLETDLFNWRKEKQMVQMQVFFYHNGYHYSNGLSGQDPQFIGRVSHFAENLKEGNASIRIHDVQLADHGEYICLFPRLTPRLQTCHVELIIGEFCHFILQYEPSQSKYLWFLF